MTRTDHFWPLDRFGNFFNHIDNFPAETFLFVTSGGIDATKASNGAKSHALNGVAVDAADMDSDSDGSVALNDANGDEG